MGRKDTSTVAKVDKTAISEACCTRGSSMNYIVVRAAASAVVNATALPPLKVVSLFVLSYPFIFSETLQARIPFA